MNAWVCARCGKVSTEDIGDQREGSQPPADWHQLGMTVVKDDGTTFRQAVSWEHCNKSLANWFRTG